MTVRPHNDDGNVPTLVRRVGVRLALAFSYPGPELTTPKIIRSKSESESFDQFKAGAWLIVRALSDSQLITSPAWLNVFNTRATVAFLFDSSPGITAIQAISWLGYIIEKVSGKSYEDFLRESFFEPLGMTNTSVHHTTDVVEQAADGYFFWKGKMKKAANWDPSRLGSAGSLYSTSKMH